MEMVVGRAEGEAGSSDRMTDLYVRHAPMARRFAFLLCGDAHQADDAVQEAFLRVLGRFGELRSEGAFPAYLRRTIVNVLRTQARREARDRERAAAHDRMQAVRSAEVDVVGDELLWQALSALPDRQRVALVCRFWLDLSEAETSAVVGCRRGTVKSLLSRGLAALREVVADE